MIIADSSRQTTTPVRGAVCWPSWPSGRMRSKPCASEWAKCRPRNLIRLIPAEEVRLVLSNGCRAQRGPADTTTRHMAEIAGVGVGSLYEYFENKQAIFNAMSQRFIVIMRYLMEHPETLRVSRIPAITYIGINGGIFAVIRHLSDPDPMVSFDEMADGLASMIGHYIAAELSLLGDVVR
ncbi:helix-turn-helix domain-containing protein [Marinobacter shengliensis]